jgi:putative ABC transport system permease protein
MMLSAALRLAFEAIARNLVRSLLTVLGVVIGVAAVITMVTIGNGASRAVADQISSLGSNLLVVRPGQQIGLASTGAGPRPFKVSDVAAISAQVGGIEAMTGAQVASATVVYRAQNWSTTVVGATNDYFAARKLDLAAGRVFNEAEERAGRPACVIGETIRRQLFGAVNPVGARLRVKRFACDVVGLLKSKGQASLGQDQDDLIIMPLKTVQRRLTGAQDLAVIIVSVTSQAEMDGVKAQIGRLLRERRHLARNEEDDFSVLDTRQIADALAGTTRVLTMLLGAVAAVSLLVGGIGIMNIMLVSVTERTREIGIRLAVGALEGDVLLQFLIEAVALSAFGGVVGVALAAGASFGLAKMMHVPFAFDIAVNIVAFVVASIIGVVFGFFPAQRAASLDPIVALRHE